MEITAVPRQFGLIEPKVHDGVHKLYDENTPPPPTPYQLQTPHRMKSTLSKKELFNLNKYNCCHIESECKYVLLKHFSVHLFGIFETNIIIKHFRFFFK